MPITEVAASLKVTATGRDRDAPLLLRRGGRGWGVDPSGHYRADMYAAVVEAGLDPREVTAYASGTVRSAGSSWRNTPVRIVAAPTRHEHRSNRAALFEIISEHSDQLARKTLLQLDAPAGGNVVALTR